MSEKGNGNAAQRAAQLERSFYKARDKLNRFLEKNGDAVEHLRKLGGKFNEALDHYKAALRELTTDRGVPRLAHGENEEFKVSATKRTVQHPDVLLKVLPEEELLNAQAIRKKVVYTLREKESLELVAEGKIDEKIFKQAFEKVDGTPQVRCPYDPVAL